jgi:HSP20 family protein
MKAVTMYRPATFENALNDFNHYLESFFDDSPLTASLVAPLATGTRVLNRLPPVDIRETGNAYIIEADLPGYDEKSIEVQVNGGTLTIESKKEDEKEAKSPDGAYLLQERRKFSFSRSFSLPDTADPETVSASFKNGILSLEIKKRAETQKRIIEIK